MTDPGKKETQSEIDQPHDDGPVLRWSTHPMKRRPWVAVAVTLFVMLCGAIVYSITDHSRVFTVLTLVALLLSLAKFYFPTRYAMNQHGVVIKTTTQTVEKPWSMYRSFYPDKNGVLLSPFAEPTRLENFRGVFLLFNDNRDEVIAFLNQFVKQTNAGSEEKS